jgi:peptide/nickel transport system substrate-binding protein
VPLTGGVYAFFNTSAGVLKNGDIRRALTKAVNTSTVISSLGYPVVPLRGPLLSEHTAYNGSLVQFKQDIKAANKLLDGAGWKMQNDGIRGKDGKPLVFSISAQDTPEYQRVAEALRIQWLAVGVQVKIVPLSDTDLKTALVAHNYDALLHGISLGVDPDVFAFWHSSQADARSMSRLNFSEYQSQAADQALEAGRTRDDPKLRAIKYEPFLKAWRQDAPAIALYQPRFLYLTHTQIFGFDPNTFNNNLDRFRNVHNWQIRQQKVNK